MYINNILIIHINVYNEELRRQCEMTISSMEDRELRELLICTCILKTVIVRYQSQDGKHLYSPAI